MVENESKLRERICLDLVNKPSSIFCILTANEKELLLNNMICNFYKKGTKIYKEGDKPQGLVCLYEGKAKIFKEGVGGREQIVRMAKPIGFIGYRALFAEENNIASAVAIEDSITCTLSYNLTLKLIRSNPEFSLNIIRSFANELGFSNNRTVTLTQKHIRGRLAESLLFLKDTYGFEDDKETVKIYLSREDLASLSNMTTSNAIRTLSTFANEGVISIEGRKIKILDSRKLDRISKLG